MEIHKTGSEVKELIDKMDLLQVSDEKVIIKWVSDVISEQKHMVEKYKNGKVNVLKALIGMVIKKSKGKANPVLVDELMNKELSK